LIETSSSLNFQTF